MNAADQKLLDVLDACDAYLEKGEALHTALRAAFFSLTQAKYSLGANKVGQLQYDSCVKATVLVSSRAQVGEDAVRFSAEDLLTQRGRVEGAAEPASGTPSKGDSGPDLDSQASEQTKGPNNSESEEPADFIRDLADRYGCGDTASSSWAEAEAASHKDPLSWFSGGLVAPSLRTAQAEFREAIFYIIDLLNQRAQLESALSR